MVRNGIVHVQFHCNHLAFLIATVATAVLFVEMPEQRLPCLLCRRLSCQHDNGFANHGIGFRLVIPAVLHPQAGLAVPLCHTWRMNPRHTSRMYALAFAHRGVGACKEFRTFGIEISEEQPVTVDRLVKQLYCR